MKPLHLIILLAFGLIAGVLAKNAVDEIKLRVTNHERQAQALKERDRNLKPQFTASQKAIPLLIEARGVLDKRPKYNSEMKYYVRHLEPILKELDRLHFSESPTDEALGSFTASLRVDLQAWRRVDDSMDAVHWFDADRVSDLNRQAGDLLTVLKAP